FADVGILGAADQQLLLGRLDHALQLPGRRDVMVYQQVEQFGSNVVAAPAQQVGRRFQPGPQRAVIGRGAAPHGEQETATDHNLRFAEHGPVAADLDRHRHDQHAMPEINDFGTAVRLQHFVARLGPYAQIVGHAPQQVVGGGAQAYPQ